MNWGGGGGGAMEGGGGIRICPSSSSSTDLAPPIDRLSGLPVHGGKQCDYLAHIRQIW